MAVLNVVPHIDFDVNNAQHCEAATLPFTLGRLHPTLRFNLREGWQSVPHMAQHFMALKLLGMMLAEGQEKTDEIQIPRSLTQQGLTLAVPGHRHVDAFEIPRDESRSALRAAGAIARMVQVGSEPVGPRSDTGRWGI